MTQEQILEYNKRCAEFLGYTLRENDCYNGDDKLVAKISFLRTEDLKFHSDWNWIMEVVEAIEKIKLYGGVNRLQFKIAGEYCQIQRKDIDNLIRPKYIRNQTKKEAVVQLINEFLFWYKGTYPYIIVFKKK